MKKIGNSSIDYIASRVAKRNKSEITVIYVEKSNILTAAVST